MWGIIPAAGKGSRIQPLAFSKELLPVGSRFDGETERPLAVSEYLVERMIAGRRKQDLLRRVARQVRHSRILRQQGVFGGCLLHRADAGRRPVRRDFSRAAVHRRGRAVLVGLPDTIWFPEDGFSLSRRRELSFLLFPVDRPEFFDAVVTDEAGRVLEIQVKSRDGSEQMDLGRIQDARERLRRIAQSLDRARARRTSISARW